MKKFFYDEKAQIVFLSLAVLLSRIPFLWAGFGSEEDSWLLALTAKNISETGEYEMSRAPAHPVQEYVYSWMYHDGLSVFAANLISAVFGTAAILFFSLALKNANFRHYIFAGFALGFTPVVFIASTYTIDYMWALALLLAAFYFLTLQQDRFANIALAGICLGIAIGCRITSAAMLLPFSFLLFYRFKSVKKIFVLTTVSFITGSIAYLPVLKTYGLTFFTFADQFPYPPFAKVFYKATIGVFGLMGTLTILVFTFLLSRKRKSIQQTEFLLQLKNRQWLFICMLTTVLYTISYLWLPQKSAYLIPAVPFVILLFGIFLQSVPFRILCTILTASSFFLSINLTDEFRGAEYSPLSVKFTTANQEIFLDLLTGAVFADHTKRLNKIRFIEKVFQKIQRERNKTVLICGWWYNQLLVRQWNEKTNPLVIPVFYIQQPTAKKYMAKGYEIYFLPEQNVYNDQYSEMHFTDSLAKPYFPGKD